MSSTFDQLLEKLRTEHERVLREAKSAPVTFSLQDHSEDWSVNEESPLSREESDEAMLSQRQGHVAGTRCRKAEELQTPKCAGQSTVDEPAQHREFAGELLSQMTSQSASGGCDSPKPSTPPSRNAEWEDLVGAYESMMAKARPSHSIRALKIVGKVERDLAPFRRFVEKKHVRFTAAETIVRSVAFHVAVSFLIVANIIVLIVESDREVRKSFERYYHGQPAQSSGDPDATFEAIEMIFTVAFSVELALRMMAEECAFLFGSNWKWNSFDSLLVITSVAQSSLRDAGVEPTFARIIRVLRMSRALRVIRLFEIFRDLRVMMDSIFYILLPLAWSVLMLSLVLFLFSFLFVNAVSNHVSTAAADDGKDSITEELHTYFRSAPMTMLSLYMCLTNGQSWWYIMRPLHAMSEGYTMLFVAFIAFLQLGVLNIITGVFVGNASLAFQKDLEMIAMANQEEHTYLMGQLGKVFDLLDQDGDGIIDLHEFESWTEIDQVVGFFQRVLALESWKVGRFFKVLDFNGDNQIEREEFVVGCMRLRGGAKNMDQEILSSQFGSLKRDMKRVKQELTDIRRSCCLRRNVEGWQSSRTVVQGAPRQTV